MGHEKLLTENLPEPALGISRYTLDDRLAREFEHLGGKLHTGKRVSTNDQMTDGYVWAAGKPRHKKNNQPDWIGLKIHATGATLDGLHMHSSNSRGQGGYVGLAQVENQRVNCCGLFHLRPDIRPTEIKQHCDSPAALIMAYAEACGMSELLKMMHTWQFDPASFTATAGFTLGHQPAHHSFSLGDAAWLIPPFTGNGMSMAMESSALAAPWLEAYSIGKITWTEAETQYQHHAKEHFHRRMRLSKIMHPLLFHFPGQSMLKASSKAGLLPFQSIFRQLRKP